MSFEAFHYDQKRLRVEGTRQWKLWFSETEEGLAFRLLTKDSANDCYVTLNGTGLPILGDLPVQEDDNGETYFTDQFGFMNAEGSVRIYLDRENRDLVWITATGAYGREECSFRAPGPLMPEIAG